jgi:hypothetical protein
MRRLMQQVGIQRGRRTARQLAVGERSRRVQSVPGRPGDLPGLRSYPKEKPDCWTRRRAFAQVRRSSNIQLLSFSLVSLADLGGYL